ncbi:hypothetical protein [Vibrio maritimus]|uniref:hypothetical protein n=1 Tax=Vibrio maritimus TaxID=990268 RepID=UPI003735259F
MKLLTILALTFTSTSAFALTDQQLCENYGQALASHDEPAQVQFLAEQQSRIESNAWTLSAESCQAHIEEGRQIFFFEMDVQGWLD